MKKVTVADVLNMSVEERILFVEDVWDSIATTHETVLLTEAQRTELDKRLDEYHKNPKAGSPWADVKKRILKL